MGVGLLLNLAAGLRESNSGTLARASETGYRVSTFLHILDRKATGINSEKSS